MAWAFVILHIGSSLKRCTIRGVLKDAFVCRFLFKVSTLSSVWRCLCVCVCMCDLFTILHEIEWGSGIWRKRRNFGAYAWLERLRVRENIHEVPLCRKRGQTASLPIHLYENTKRKGADGVPQSTLEHQNDEFLSWFHVDIFFKLSTLRDKLAGRRYSSMRHCRLFFPLFMSPSSSSDSLSFSILFIFLQSLTSMNSLLKVIRTILRNSVCSSCYFSLLL